MRQKIVAHFGVTVCRKSLKNEPLGKIDMKILKVAVALGLATSLSACLSDDVVDDGIDTAAALSLFERSQLDNGSLADPDSLPSSATMTGFISAEIASDEFGLAFMGDMTVEADFENSAMTGTAKNFGLYSLVGDCKSNADCEVTYENALDGELVMSSGVMTPDRNQFYFELDGEISGPYSDDDGGIDMVADISLKTDERAGFFRDSEGLFARAHLSGDADATWTDADGNETTFIGNGDEADYSALGLVGMMVVAE
jgi:hypothetical protein